MTCTVPECAHPAGSVCGYASCPGKFSRSLSSLPLLAARTSEAGQSPRPASAFTATMQTRRRVNGAPCTITAPRFSRQPTLVSGCEAHPAASDKRRGDKRQAYTLRKDGNDEICCLEHGDGNAR